MRNKNLIHRLKHNEGWNYPSSLQANPKKSPTPTTNLNWEAIPFPQCDINDMDNPILEEEVKAAIEDTASGKASGLMVLPRPF
jgi:hypothetical protein